MSQKRERASCSDRPSATMASRRKSATPTPAEPAPSINDLLIAKAAAGNTDGRKDRSAGDRSGALNIVIEGQELVAVAVEDGTSMGLREIFPLKQRMGQFLFQGLNETIDKIVIGIASDALVAPAQIFGISKALFIVGAHIENNGQR